MIWRIERNSGQERGQQNTKFSQQAKDRVSSVLCLLLSALLTQLCQVESLSISISLPNTPLSLSPCTSDGRKNRLDSTLLLTAVTFFFYFFYFLLLQDQHICPQQVILCLSFSLLFFLSFGDSRRQQLSLWVCLSTLGVCPFSTFQFVVVVVVPAVYL